MNLSRVDFEQLVNETIDNLPQKFREQIHNLAIFVEEKPTPVQIKKVHLHPGALLFGLFEGYHQAKRLNFGTVLPDRITIFRQPILASCNSKESCRRQIISTLKHEIAHHFGSDEKGAKKAGSNP